MLDAGGLGTRLLGCGDLVDGLRLRAQVARRHKRRGGRAQESGGGDRPHHCFGLLREGNNKNDNINDIDDNSINSNDSNSDRNSNSNSACLRSN